MPKSKRNLQVRLLNETLPSDKQPCPDGNHDWRRAWVRGLDVLGEVCDRCCASRERTMTPAERKYHDERYGDTFCNKSSKEHNIHWLWHKFLRLMKDDKGQWKWTPETAYKVMQKAERFARKHAKDGICIVGCDDSHFTGSDLVIVHHKDQDKWMGLSVVVLSQCSGQPPAEFFLYPNHVDSLMAALRDAKREEKRLRRCEAAKARRLQRAWEKIVREQRGRLVVLPIRRVPMIATVVAPPKDQKTVANTFWVRLSGWKPPKTESTGCRYHASFRLALSTLPETLRPKAKVGTRFRVMAVPDAEEVHDLQVTDWTPL